MLYSGIDLGTPPVNLPLMDGRGNIPKIISREYPLYSLRYGRSKTLYEKKGEADIEFKTKANFANCGA